MPSWSWLSSKGPIVFPLLNRVEQQPPDLERARVLEVHVERFGDDVFGKISSGYLRLASYTRKAYDRSARFPLSRVLERGDLGPWCEHFDDARVSCARCWFCVLEIRGARRKRPDNNGLEFIPAYLLGIILEPVDLSHRLFRRVGIFSHGWETHFSGFKKQCPEFADVTRLEDMEQEEVTII